MALFIKRLYLHLAHGFNISNEFYYVNVICSLIGIVGLTIATIIFLVTGIWGNVFDLDICLQNQCIVNFSNKYSSVVSIIKTTGGIILGIFAFGSFGIACKNYVNSKNAFNSNIHVSNVSVFLSYAQSEAGKREKLKSTSFDLLKWYNLIFPSSKNGTLEVSQLYLSKLQKIHSTINESNQRFYSTSTEEFRYKDHQTKIINTLSEIGVSLHRMPRLDFYEVEGQIFDLIEVINSSFCYLETDLALMPEREYR